MNGLEVLWFARTGFLSGMLVGGIKAAWRNGKRFHIEDKYYLAKHKYSHIKLHRERAIQMTESVMKVGVYYGIIASIACASYSLMKQTIKRHLTIQS